VYASFIRDFEACLYVRPSDRTTLERLVADGKTPQKVEKRAKIVLLSGRGAVTNAIMHEARVSKPTVWCSQEAYLVGGVERLRRKRARAHADGAWPRSPWPPVSSEPPSRVRIQVLVSSGAVEALQIARLPWSAAFRELRRGRTLDACGQLRMQSISCTCNLTGCAPKQPAAEIAYDSSSDA
jgi:hypothetical protein